MTTYYQNLSEFNFNNLAKNICAQEKYICLLKKNMLKLIKHIICYAPAANIEELHNRYNDTIAFFNHYCCLKQVLLQLHIDWQEDNAIELTAQLDDLVKRIHQDIIYPAIIEVTAGLMDVNSIREIFDDYFELNYKKLSLQAELQNLRGQFFSFLHLTLNSTKLEQDISEEKLLSLRACKQEEYQSEATIHDLLTILQEAELTRQLCEPRESDPRRFSLSQ